MGGGITLSGDKSLNVRDPISLLSAAKIGVGEESGMSDFIGRYCLPTPTKHKVKT